MLVVVLAVVVVVGVRRHKICIVHLETTLVSAVEAAGGGPSVVNFAPYKESGLYDFVVGLDYGQSYISTFDKGWERIFNDYMNKY